MDNLTCLLCFEAKVEPFKSLREKSFGQMRDWEYFSCTNCGLIFMNPQQFLTAAEERSRYEQHKNLAEDKAYVAHLRRLWEPLKRNMLENQSDSEKSKLAGQKNKLRGLDFGSGPNPVMAEIIAGEGFDIEVFDKIYAHDNRVLIDEHYDFVICNEVVEHFHNPGQEFLTISQIVKPGGFIAVGTKPYSEDIDFAQWAYRRDDTHVCFYSLETMSFISNEFGWERMDWGEDWWVWQKH